MSALTILRAGAQLSQLQGIGALLSTMAFLDTAFNLATGRLALSSGDSFMSMAKDAGKGAIGLYEEKYNGHRETGNLVSMVFGNIDELAILFFNIAASSLSSGRRFAIGSTLAAWQLLQAGDELFRGDGDFWKDKLIDLPLNLIKAFSLVPGMGMGRGITLLTKKSKLQNTLKGGLKGKAKRRAERKLKSVDEALEQSAIPLGQYASNFKPILRGLGLGWTG